MPPVGEGPVRALPGNSACYPRQVFIANANLLGEGFWEAEFNEALLQQNCTLWISPTLEVQQHQHRGILEYVALRYRHGRCYGGRRLRCASQPERKRLLRSIPFIPLALFFRAARAVWRKRRNRGRFLLVSPLLVVYFCAWATGEAVGYLFGAGQSCLDTD